MTSTENPFAAISLAHNSPETLPPATTTSKFTDFVSLSII